MKRIVSAPSLPVLALVLVIGSVCGKLPGRNLSYAAQKGMMPELSPTRVAIGVEAKIGRARELPVMRMILGIPTQSGAQSYLTEIGANGLAPLVEMPYGFTNGEFSFDGQFMAFDNCGDRYNKPRGIYVVNIANQTSRRIHPLTSKFCTSVRWAPDSQRLSFINQDDNRLQVINLATNEVTSLPSTYVNLHWWGPNSDQIVFERGKGGHRELFISDLEGRERQLTYLKNFNNGETWAPSWSPDGSLIVFTADESAGKLSLYTIAPDGSGLKKLEIPDTAYSPRWSTDGEWIIYLSSRKLMQIHKDGTGLKLIGNLQDYGANFGRSSFSLGPKN
jgi:Tol biopolymer transport system component